MSYGGRKVTISSTAWLVSLLLIFGIALFTNPTTSVGFIVVFLILLLVFLSSTGFILADISGQKEKGHRSKIIISSIAIVLIVMLRSTQSLGAVDWVILALTIAGSFFYFNKRNE